jgi:hypothetical protein
MRPEGGPTSTRQDAPPGLFLARDGTWFHDGLGIHHPRLAALLHRSIARGDDGGLIVTMGRDRLSFAAEDAPYLVRALRIDDATATLSDGTEETLVGPLLVDVAGRVRVRVKNGGFWALLSRATASVVMGGLDEDGTHVIIGARALDVVEESRARWSD